MRRALLAFLLVVPAVGQSEEIRDPDLEQAQAIVNSIGRLNRERRVVVVRRYGPRSIGDLTPVTTETARSRRPFGAAPHLLDLPPFADVDESRAPVGVPPAAEDATQGPAGVLASESTLPESG